MKPTYLFLFLLLLARPGFSQPACGDIFLDSQADVDAFEFSGCISASEVFVLDLTGDITNLDGLRNLVSIGKLFILNSNLLENIDGLSNVTSIDTINIQNNNGLIHLDGLRNVVSVVADIFICCNASLSHIDGLSSLSTVDGPLFVGLNANLVNVNGLSSLNSTSGDLTISLNPSLINIDGLANLNTVGRDFVLFENAILNNVDGLSNLSTVGRDLYITDNPSLNSLSQFCGLFNLLNGGGISDSEYFVSGNGYNPTQAEILAPGACSPPVVPTLSEWGLIILSLIFIVLGVIGIKQPELSLKRSVNHV